VKRPDAIEMPRCAPPYAFGAAEEPEEGGRGASTSQAFALHSPLAVEMLGMV